MWRDLRTEEQRRDRDRRTWAQYEKVRFQAKLKTVGEKEIGPVYFGTAFSEPPEFTFSLARTIDSTSAKYPVLSSKPVNGINPFFIDYSTNMPTDTKRSHGVWEYQGLVDGSFEVQGLYAATDAADKYIPYITEWSTYSIPSWNQMIDGVDSATNRVAYQYAASKRYSTRIAGNPTADSTNGFPLVGSNFWVQEGSGSWELSSERTGPVTGDAWPGRWSAKCSLSAGVSPWLQPITPRVAYHASNNRSFFALASDAERWQWLHIDKWYWNPTFDEVDANAYHQWIMDPGSHKGQRFTVWVYASGTVSLEAQWALTTLDPTPLIETTHDNTEQTVWHTETQTSEDIGPGSWRQVTFDFIPPEDVWPNLSQTGTLDLASQGAHSPPQSHRWAGVAVRFRVRGNTDPDVWVDNAQCYPLVENVADAPSVTIGVKEWIVDEYGAYIGAHLWLKASNV